MVLESFEFIGDVVYFTYKSYRVAMVVYFEYSDSDLFSHNNLLLGDFEASRPIGPLLLQVNSLPPLISNF